MVKHLQKEAKLSTVKLIEQNEAHNRMVQWFFSFPNTKIGLNDLASALGISKTTANKAVAELENIGFLRKEVFGKAWIIQCNMQHPDNFTKKVAFNLSMVYAAYQGGLREDILRVVGNAKAVILFGSYRKGDDLETSDLDIAVEVADNLGVRLVPLGVIPKFGYRSNVSVNLHVFSRNKVDINLFSNIANGIVIEGFLEVRV